MAVVSVLLGVLIVLGWIVVGLLALVGVILCMPIHLAGQVRSIDLRGETPDELLSDLSGFSWGARVNALLGLVRLDAEGQAQTTKVSLKVFGFTFHPGDAKGNKSFEGRGKPNRKPQDGATSHGKTNGNRERSRRSKGSKKRFSPLQVGEIIKLLPEIRLLLVKVWRRLRPAVHGHVIFGFFDPALTGMSQAIVAALPIGKSFRLIPDFTEGRLSGWFGLRVTIAPMSMVALLFSTALRPAVRSWWWAHLKRSLIRTFSVKKKSGTNKKEAVSIW